MPSFQYTALDRNGKKIRSEVQAGSESMARKQAKDRGHFIIKMGVDSGRMKFDFFKTSQISSMRVPGKDLVFFTRQLGTLLKSGFTLDGALAAISEQITHSGFHSAILEVDRAVKEGKTLYESLNKYPYLTSVKDFDDKNDANIFKGYEHLSLTFVIRLLYFKCKAYISRLFSKF